MADIDTIGLIEVTSIASGFRVQDAVLKTAPVRLLLARTICSGKYLVVVSGDVASVKAAVAAGASMADGVLIESAVLSRIHPSIFPALGAGVQLDDITATALGVLETFTAAGIVGAADAAVKHASVSLLRVHLAMAVGGKGFALLSGDLAHVQAAVEAGAAFAGEHGILAGKAVIAHPSPELFREYI